VPNILILSVVFPSDILQSVNMLSAVSAECHYTQYCYTEYPYAEYC
jgi:hypothetical protein